MVRKSSEIEKKHLLGTTLIRIKSEIEINTLFGRALVRIMTKIEKNTLFKWGFGKDKVKNKEKHPFW